jgi:opacity protein-like surface antigen
MKGSVILFVLGLVCMPLLSAFAADRLTGEEYFGDIPPKFAVGVRASVHDISGIPFRENTYFPEELDFDTDWGYGFSAEYWFTPSISLELAFDHVKTEDTYSGYRAAGFAPPLTGLDSVDVSLNDWALSLKYTFATKARLRPYVLAGLDVFLANIDYSIPVEALYGYQGVNGDVDSAWGWHVGAGAEYRFTDNLGLFGEVRYRSGSSDIDTTVWTLTTSWSSTNEIEYDGFVGTLGLKVYW